jgi:hypothetical protein
MQRNINHDRVEVFILGLGETYASITNVLWT